MKALLIFLLLAGAAAAALQEGPPASVPAATVRWRNGESLPGDLLSVSGDEVAWRTPLFADPLRLRLSALRRIELPATGANPADAFRVILRDGSHLYGDLTGITKETVSLHSTRLGEVVLRRAEVLTVRRLRGGSIVSAGPLGELGWKLLTAKDAPEGEQMGSVTSTLPLLGGPGGTLPLRAWNSGAGYPIDLPPKCDIRFRISASKRAEFILGFEGTGSDQLRIETWGDQLVLTAGSQFQLIRQLGAKERVTALQLCWDRPARKCIVYSPAGEKLTEWTAPEKIGLAPARVSLRNKGRDLTLELLQVREWEGAPPDRLDPGQPRIELADGHARAGVVREATDDTLSFQKAGQEEVEKMPLALVDTIVFSAAAPASPETEPTLTFGDGTLLHGRLLGVKNGTATLASPAAELPLSASLEGMRQLRLNGAEPAEGDARETPLAELDEFSSGPTHLHGRCVGRGEKQFRWLPVGGVEPVRLQESAPFHVTRGFGSGVPFTAPEALFYTRNGEILPGTLRTLDDSGVEIESGVTEATRLSLSQIGAIQFGRTGSRPLNGFADAEWQFKGLDRGSAKAPGAPLLLEPGMSVAHPTATLSHELRFTLKSGSFNTTRLRLFCAGTDPSRSVNLLIVQMSSRLTTGLESSEGQMNFQQQGRIASGTDNDFRIVLLDKKLELYVDGALWQTLACDPANRAGAGLVIEPASVWGNSVEPITISKFSALPAPGLVAPPNISSETRLQALTVPRFRQDLPPKHVLLGANGDLLRGEIEAVTTTHFGFRSGLEILRVPRERVQAVIWLQPPAGSGAPGAPAAAPTLPELDQPVNIRMSPSTLTLSSCLQMLQHGFPDLAFVPPESRSRQSARFMFTGQSLREVLEQICERYSVTYRTEARSVIFEAAATGAGARRNDLLTRTYWLPEQAFPNRGDVTAALVAKEVPFPRGTTAVWDPASRQLTVQIVPSAVAKLKAVLEAEFGDRLAQPTHWVQLASGARFPLQVDAFRDDAVVGRHPLYGTCRVPLADVYLLDSAPPEVDRTALAMLGWQLIPAREPVVAEGGGESSPIRGKAAQPFKLPIVGGGEFALESAKGKVVVLDFWATWCGPCIKSLPALIAAMGALPAERVAFWGVNQGEPAAQVQQFLQTRGWKLPTLLDATQTVGRQFGVEGIPHTVIIGPDGKIAWVKTGYSPEGAEEAAAAVKKLLETP